MQLVLSQCYSCMIAQKSWKTREKLFFACCAWVQKALEELSPFTDSSSDLNSDDDCNEKTNPPEKKGR